MDSSSGIARLQRRVAELETSAIELVQTEEALKESEAKYRRLHESMMDAFVSVDMKGHILDSKAAYRALLGYTADELQRLTYIDLTPAPWRKMEARIVKEQILPLGYSAVYEKEYRRKDGTTFPAELRTFLVRDDAGAPTSMWAIVRDLTDRKRAEALLQESEAQYRALFEQAADAIVVFDPETIAFLEFNDEACRRLGYTRQEFAKLKISDVEAIESAEDVKFHSRKIPSEGIAVFETKHRTKDNAVMDIEVRAKAIRIGGRTLIQGVWRDITERKRAEAALHESEERFRVILENSVDVIYRRNLQVDRYDCVSPSVETLTGYTPEEFMSGGLQTTVERVHPDDRENAQRAIQDVLTSASGRGGAEYRYRRKDGAYRWFADHYTVTRDAEGRLQYWVGTVRDVTDLRQAEDALKRAHDELEARVVDRTAALSAANAELQARSNQLARLATELTTAEQRERHRLAETIHDDLQQLLFVARMQTHALRPMAKIRKEVQAVDSLCATMEEAFASARHLVQSLYPPALFHRDLPTAMQWLVEEFRKRHNVSVKLQTAGILEDLPEPMIAMLFKAAQELLFNVAKHAGVTRATLRLARKSGALQLTVADRGKGFDPATLLGPGRMGSGFGLFSLRERVRLIGGSVTLDSAVGQGCRIVLAIPFPDGQPALRAKEAAPKKPRAKTVRPAWRHT